MMCDFAWHRKCTRQDTVQTKDRQSTTFVWVDFYKWNHTFSVIHHSWDSQNYLLYVPFICAFPWTVHWLKYLSESVLLLLLPCFSLLGVDDASVFLFVFGKDVAPVFSVCQWGTPVANLCVVISLTSRPVLASFWTVVDLMLWCVYVVVPDAL